ncbi:MAG: hypothetical protein WCP53_06595, partial [Verrucomicrobiota bacterium]
ATAPVVASWWRRTTTGVILTHVASALVGATIGVFIGRATHGGASDEVAAPAEAPAQAAE